MAKKWMSGLLTAVMLIATLSVFPMGVAAAADVEHMTTGKISDMALGALTTADGWKIIKTDNFRKATVVQTALQNGENGKALGLEYPYNKSGNYGDQVSVETPRMYNFIAGETYTISFWTKVDTASTGSALTVRPFFSQANKMVDVQMTDQAFHTDTANVTTNVWEKQTFTVTAPVNARALRIRFYGNAIKVYISDISVKGQGHVAPAGVELIDDEEINSAAAWSLVDGANADSYSLNTVEEAGNKMLKYSATASATGKKAYYTYVVENLVPGETYLFSGKIKVTKGGRSDGSITINMSAGSNSAGYAQDVADYFAEFYSPITIPADCDSATIRVGVYGVAETTEFYLDDLSLIGKKQEKVKFYDTEGKVIDALTNGSKVNAKVNYYYYGPESSQPVTLILGLFEKVGDRYYLVDFKKAPGTATVDVPAVCEAPIDIPQEGDYELRAFVWNNLTLMQPLQEMACLNK